MDVLETKSIELPSNHKGGIEGEKEYAFAGLSKQKMFLLAGDLFCVLVALALFHVTDASTEGFSWRYLSSSVGRAMVSLVCYPSALYVFDMYNMERCFNAGEAAKRSVFAVVLGGLLLTLLTTPAGQTALVKTGLLTVLLWALFTGWRRIYSSLCQTAITKKRVLIVGTGFSGRTMYDLLSFPVSPYTVKGFVDDPEGGGAIAERNEILGTSDRIAELARITDAASLILTPPYNHSPQFTRSVLEARLMGTKVQEMADVYEQLTGRVPIDHIQDEWLLSAGGFRILHKPYVRHLKRLIDAALSFVLLLLACPLILLVSLLIRLDSTGSVLYKQERIGKDGKTFSMYKFRSMKADAELNGVQWATNNDPRITRVGKWLRISHLDELPQLWNVVKGDMSLVGPRPERPYFVCMLEQKLPYYAIRHCVKPGVTGWAQVTFRYGASMEDARRKLEADVYYVKNMSLVFDLKILLKTLGVVFLGQGAR